jgi:hypothetical protein
VLYSCLECGRDNGSTTLVLQDGHRQRLKRPFLPRADWVNHGAKNKAVSHFEMVDGFVAESSIQ